MRISLLNLDKRQSGNSQQIPTNLWNTDSILRGDHELDREDKIVTSVPEEEITC